LDGEGKSPAGTSIPLDSGRDERFYFGPIFNALQKLTQALNHAMLVLDFRCAWLVPHDNPLSLEILEKQEDITLLPDVPK
jgi:hypothetical protein